jgi:steroid 5-alpha reductase family enzyme
MPVLSVPAGLLASTALVVLALMTTLWLVSLALRNASIVDLFWGPGFAVVSWVALWWSVAHGFAPEEGARRLMLALPVTVWGLRLGGYLSFRNLGKGEDYRYAEMRRRRGRSFWAQSLPRVFLLQGVLMWVVSLPVQVGMAAPGRAGLGPAVWMGAVVWLTGLCFEATGDWQLSRFKSRPANKGLVMDRGLWRYTRHPNYFGDFLVWWGLYVMALDGPGAWWTIVGPLLMSTLLLRVSGVALLEKTITARRPGYAEYVRRTSVFFPRSPRR